MQKPVVRGILCLALASGMVASVPAVRRAVAQDLTGSETREPNGQFVENSGHRSPKNGKEKDISGTWGGKATAFAGLFVILALAWASSRQRRRLPIRVLGWGLALQFAVGLLALRSPAGAWVFGGIKEAFIKLLAFTEIGSWFLFRGYLHQEFSIALNVLPTIIFFSSLMAVLYHLGIMQRVVAGMAWVMRRTMGTSAAETLSTAANVFVGQTEAPLMIRPYLAAMTRSELFAVMVAGFATVAGSVFGAYVGLLQGFFPDIAGHLLAASLISAPGALMIAKLMLPEMEASKVREASLSAERPDCNLVEAAARGAGEGLKLALNVAAMLLAFVALVALANYLLSLPFAFYDWTFEVNTTPVTLQQLFGWVFSPLALLMGIEWSDAAMVGSLLGEKIVLNEFIAFESLAKASAEGSLSPRSALIASYALCGFANFGSIAVQIGGIGGLVPERKSEVAELGIRAMLGGMLATCMTACVANILL